MSSDMRGDMREDMREDMRGDRSGTVGNAGDARGQWQIAFGQTRHRRLRPVQRKFAYRSFFVRLPMHLLSGQRRGNWLIGLNRPALLSVHDRDHGDGGADCRWLHDALAQAGIAAPASIWLQTFPRILGYVFNPVSFWFCHREDGALIAVMAEVNNTFGQRHCYLLSQRDSAPIKAGSLLQAQKCFHVSPFCALEGDYRFRFMHSRGQVCATVDYHDDDGALLLTSLSGTLEPLNRSAALKALTRYPLFTLSVMARIHWQAVKLWLARVPFHRLPEAPRRFVTRGIR